MSFTDSVYKIVSLIPKGKVATYGQVAKLAGNPKAARAVGAAMKHNPNLKIIPCHRVIAADGSLHGYSSKGGLEGKRKMLVSEGVVFKGAKVDLTASQF